MLDEQRNFALCISKIDDEAMCEFQFAYSFFFLFSKAVNELYYDEFEL